MIEVNFDGLIGPSHNYAGLSLGNLASASNAGAEASPRAAALQGLAKMRRMLDLGLTQGLFVPLDRPDTAWLRSLGFTGSDDDVCRAAWRDEPALLSSAMSASSMWTANAATVSPAPDTHDGRCHITAANLATMVHRSIEHEHVVKQLRLAFQDPRYFAVHPALPAVFGDEGAANFMRLAPSHGVRGVEVFVYAEGRFGGFPARQSRVASEAVARFHGVSRDDAIFVRQSAEAIAAGAFHNDVVAVANENVLLAHEQAFAEPALVHRQIRDRMPEAVIVEVPASRVSLAAATRSYLFNSQLVTLPTGGMMLIVPAETRETPEVWSWLTEQIAAGGPIGAVEVVDVRESMRNGGGPACLRLRVAASAEAVAAIDARFLLDAAKCDRIQTVVESSWPARIVPSDLGEPELWHQIRAARAALLAALGFSEGEL